MKRFLLILFVLGSTTWFCAEVYTLGERIANDTAASIKLHSADK